MGPALSAGPGSGVGAEHKHLPHYNIVYFIWLSAGHAHAALSSELYSEKSGCVHTAGSMTMPNHPFSYICCLYKNCHRPPPPTHHVAAQSLSSFTDDIGRQFLL